MYRLPIATHNRIVRGEIPILYMVITTHFGARAYAKKSSVAPALAGSLGCLPRVLSFGSFDRTLVPKTADILAAYTRKQQQHVSVKLDNADAYFSKLLGKEPFLARPVEIYCGFEDEAAANHIKIFSGVVSQVSVGSVLTIEADEKSFNSPTGKTLDSTFYLRRAGNYANPLNTADLLPVVYGDLTDGTEGVWVLPCIDKVNFVYCYADHPVLSVAAGNAVEIYSAGVLVDPADYVFNHSHDFEPPDPPPAVHDTGDDIATVTFTADQGENVITARGKGKIMLPLTLAGETPIANIVDMVGDFLTGENDFTAAIFEATAKAKAVQTFDKWSYVAGGVIHQDGKIWDIITSMMSSFLGSAYLNGAGKLVLEIDDGTIDQYSAGVPATLPKQDTTMNSAVLRYADIINQCPCNYRYSYVYGQFRSATDDTDHADGISQGVYGVKKPSSPYQLYWSRTLATVQAVQDTIVGKYADPLYEIEIEDATLKRIYVDVGDPITYSADFLYDRNGQAMMDATWKVISVTPDFAAGKIKFRCLQIAYRDAVPPAAETPWDGTLALMIPAIPTVAAPALTTVEETPVAPDTVALSVLADVPTVSVSTIVKYKVTYDGNGNTGGTAPADANWYAGGATVTVLGNTGALVKTGYTWTCWNTAADGSGTDYDSADTFALSAAATLYAKWTAA